MILVNQIIDDALALIDEHAVGASAEKHWGELAVRLLNGMLSDWVTRGLYNPELVTYEFTPKTAINKFTMGYDDSVKTISGSRYSIEATLNAGGTYYKVIDEYGLIAYKNTGTGNKYELVVTEDASGDFYKISSGFTQLKVGDCPIQFGDITAIQVDNGTVTYNPKKITVGEYYSLSVRTTQSTPVFYAPDYNYPFTTVYIYPTLIPGYKVRIVGKPTVEAITSPQNKIKISRHYYDAILYNLACKLYPFFKRDTGIDNSIIIQAKSGLEGLRGRATQQINAKVKCPYVGMGNTGSGFWNSSLNTAPMVGN